MWGFRCLEMGVEDVSSSLRYAESFAATAIVDRGEADFGVRDFLSR
jgi:hypothetical protein